MGKISGKLIQISAYVVIAATIGFLIGIAKDCSHIKSYDVSGYSKGDTIDIAVVYSPELFYHDSDSLAGINNEVINYFSADTQTPIKIWPVSDMAAAMTMLESGACDILASVPLDNNIKNRFLTSQSIFLDRLVLIQNRDTLTGEIVITTPLDLNGKTVFIPSGSASAQRLKNLADEIGGSIEVVEQEDLSDELLSLKVASGDIPFAVVNERVAKNIALKYPNLSYDNPVSFTQFQVWLFNTQDTVLYQKFNDWFEEFKESYDYHTLTTDIK